jgi:hypothetical protein
MTNDNIVGVFNKNKKKSTLTKPVKASKPMQKATATPKAKPIKVKPVKTPKVKAPQLHQTQQPRQTPQYQNTDFKFSTSVEQSGVSILTDFRGKLIHKFLLPHTDYALFVSLHPQQKYNYVQVRVRPNSFWNDMQLVNQVILTVCNIFDSLFAEAQRILRQQEQQQRR